MPTRTGNLSLAVLISLACASCSGSEEDARQEFDEVVAASNRCADASECALVFVYCQLGCFEAIDASKKAAVEEKARDLAVEYEIGGQSCAYDCASPGPLECVDGRCKVGASQ